MFHCSLPGFYKYPGMHPARHTWISVYFSLASELAIHHHSRQCHDNNMMTWCNWSAHYFLYINVIHLLFSPVFLCARHGKIDVAKPLSRVTFSLDAPIFSKNLFQNVGHNNHDFINLKISSTNLASCLKVLCIYRRGMYTCILYCVWWKTSCKYNVSLKCSYIVQGIVRW
jgi:hypothetical protein